MAHFWIVHDTADGKRVMIQQADYLLMARLKASMAGLPGKFVEVHELKPKMVKAIPDKMIGRVLSPNEAARLLKNFEI